MERHMWQKKKIFCHFYGIGTCGQESTHENDRVIFVHEGERGEGCRMEPCSICDKAIQVVCHDFATKGECQFKYKHMNKYTLFYHKQENCKPDCNFCKSSVPNSLQSIDDERRLISKRSFEKKKSERNENELERVSAPWAIRLFYVNYRDIVKSRLGDDCSLKAYPGKVVLACPGLKTDIAVKALTEMWNEFLKVNKTSGYEKYFILDDTMQVIVENGLEISDLLFRDEFNSLKLELDVERPADEVKLMLNLEESNIRYYRPARSETIKDIIICYRNKVDSLRALKVFEDKMANQSIPIKAVFPMIYAGNGFTGLTLRVKVTLRGSQKFESNSGVGEALKIKIFKDFGIDESMVKKCQLKPSKKNGALKFYIDCPVDNCESIIQVLSTQFQGKVVDYGISLNLKFYFAITLWMKNSLFRFMREKVELLLKYFNKKTVENPNSIFKSKYADPNLCEEDSLYCLKVKSNNILIAKEAYDAFTPLPHGITLTVHTAKDKFVDHIMKNYYLELQSEEKLVGKVRIIPHEASKSVKLYSSSEDILEHVKIRILKMASLYAGYPASTIDMKLFNMAASKKTLKAIRQKFDILYNPVKCELMVYGTNKERNEIIEALDPLNLKSESPRNEEISLGGNSPTLPKCMKCEQDMTSPKKLFLCGHSFCVACLENYLTSEEQIDLKFYKCPNIKCEKRIHYRDIAEILAPSQLHHIVMMKLDRYLDEFKEFYPRCPTQNCHGIINKVKGSVCYRCNTQFCEISTPLHQVHNGDCPIEKIENCEEIQFVESKDEIFKINDTNLQKVN